MPAPRLPKFRLRSLLIAVAILAVPLAFVRPFFKEMGGRTDVGFTLGGIRAGFLRYESGHTVKCQLYVNFETDQQWIAPKPYLIE